MKLNFSTLDDYEQKVIINKAKEANIEPEGLFEAYKATMECNFEQDIHDIINEDYDYLTSEYGLDKERH